MGLLTNRIDRENLKPGDHIYSWRTAYIYAHHGIYIGDDKVIHFTRHGHEVGTGTKLDCLSASSMPANPEVPCPTCNMQEGGHGVILTCLTCFLAGGDLYRYEYAVGHAFLLTSVRAGTCTLAVSDPSDEVIRRAKYLLDKGFGNYDLTKNNCEHFALYCKTECVVVGRGSVGQSGQAASIVGSSVGALLSISMRRFISTTFLGIGIATAGQYCASKYAADISKMDTKKVPVEDLATILQVVEPPNSATVPTPNATTIQDGQTISATQSQDGQPITAAQTQDGQPITAAQTQDRQAISATPTQSEQSVSQNGQPVSETPTQNGQPISATPIQDGQSISETPAQDGQRGDACEGFDCNLPPGG